MNNDIDKNISITIGKSNEKYSITIISSDDLSIEDIHEVIFSFFDIAKSNYSMSAEEFSSFVIALEICLYTDETNFEELNKLN